MSFSLLGLLLTYIIGLLIVVSYKLKPLFELLWRRWRYKEYAFLEWTANETLQLQRAAFQGIDSGTWAGFTDAIPTTRKGEVLADLTLSYREPRGDEKLQRDSESALERGGVPDHGEAAPRRRGRPVLTMQECAKTCEPRRRQHVHLQVRRVAERTVEDVLDAKLPAVTAGKTLG